jgi:hypothetical protein
MAGNKNSEFKKEIEKCKIIFRNLKRKLKLRKKEKQFWKTILKYWKQKS